MSTAPQAVQTAPQAQQPTGLQLFNQKLTHPRTQEYLTQVLGEKRQSFVNNLTALVANSSALQACEPMTTMYAAIKATALDLPLDPNLGFAYVIPYDNSKRDPSGRPYKVKEAQFQLGYKGFIQLAIRSGQFKTINVTEVREGEIGTFDLLTGELRFNAKPNREQLPVVGYAAYFRLTNGFEKTYYATKEEVEAHAKKYSKTYGSSNANTATKSKWTTDFDAMAKKTVLKLLLSKYAPLSVEMQNAVKSDQGVIDEHGNAHYVDNSEQSVVDAVAEEISTEANGDELGMEDGDATEQTAPQPTPTPEAQAPAPAAAQTTLGPGF